MGKPTICTGENKDADQLRGKETLKVETAAWPIPFLINVLAALKGSQVLIFIYGLESGLGVLEWC